MVISPEVLMGYVNGLFWPFVRISSMLMTAPLFGARTFPIRSRILLALLISWLVFPLLPEMPSLNAFSIQGMLITAQQVVVGLAMGFILQMVFAATVVAGQTIATSMGLGFASTVDPQNGVQVPVVSQYFLILATLIFLALNGHLVMIETVVESFYLLPVSVTVFPENLAWQVASWIGQVFTGALLVAMPAVSAILLVNLAFGVMTRAAPQINIFAVGFPITILAGFIMILLSLPIFLPQFTALLEKGFLQMLLILG
ncbi:MAG: flagellar biosynthetic protein FliR [Gammaproteobacteria bacterium]|jgi:flagellar biosynthesis protein FliR|nr:flagellar biosynthetic protein FliR [Gammaproteobacteria bacterium]MBT5202525.1 flagellar biosynthetic protein FliR [Gammaproteobacteria bacterium]MBT5601562.1 flagellar biosynthetic protein FliR [Gammaproteobacteria bacterium]MBT6247483.1 flagellar biosynthetic protein FliR [Gammaproteobacteria bacterium]